MHKQKGRRPRKPGSIEIKPAIKLMPDELTRLNDICQKRDRSQGYICEEAIDRYFKQLDEWSKK